MASNKLESEAFKKMVFDSLKENKIEDSLKSVMRLRIIEKMGKDGLNNKNKAPLNLSEKLAVSMIRSFLISKGLTMTLSVLEPESGEASFFDDSQVAEVLGKSKPGFQDLIKKKKPSTSSMVQPTQSLLCKILDGIQHNVFEKYDSSTQTVTCYNDYDLDQKLQMVEEYHVGKIKQDNRTSKQIFEDRLKTLEEKFKTDLRIETKRIRDQETIKIRAEESQKYREKYQDEKDQMEKLYNTQMANLRENERRILEQYTDKVKRLEEDYRNKISGLSRQNEYVKKEANLTKTELSFEKSDLERLRNNLLAQEADLKKKQTELSRKEATFEQRLKDEVEIYKASTLKDISDKRSQLEIKLRRVNDELNDVDSLKNKIQDLTDKKLKLESDLDQERRKQEVLAEEKKLCIKDRDETREHMHMLTTNMKRLETDFERANSRIQVELV